MYVANLARSILQLFDYDEGDKAIRTREILDLDMEKGKTPVLLFSLFISGSTFSSISDVCGILALVMCSHEDC